MSLHEYLYVDHNRLGSYCDQIHPDPKVLKLPEWNAEISLTGPKVAARQTIQTRQLNTHEKVCLFYEYLERQGSAHYFHGDLPIALGDPEFRVPTFLRTTVPAARMLLPLKYGASDRPDHRGVWLYSREHLLDSGTSLWITLCLVEDLVQSDEKPKLWHMSAYSAIRAMIAECYDEFKDTPVGERECFQELAAERELIRSNPFRLFYNVDHHTAEKNPADLMYSLGAKLIDDERRVDILFRIRQTNGLQTFGYPIVVLDAQYA